MRKLVFGAVLSLTVGCATSPSPSSPPPGPVYESPTPIQLPDLGPAPELTNDIWLNVDEPLRLADLRGRVVLLEMWTFG